MSLPVIPEQYKVRFNYYRYVDVGTDSAYQLLSMAQIRRGGMSGKIIEHGGTVICQIINRETDGIVVISQARCNLKDKFNKVVGRNKALGRAYSMMRQYGYIV